MNDNNKIFDAYFHGRMSAKEALDFQSSLATTPKLKADYTFYESIKRASTDIAKDELREQIEEINLEEPHLHAENIITAKRSKVKIFNLIKAAVAIAALFIIGFWGFQNTKSTTSNDLFTQNFEPYTVKLSRGINNDTLSAIYNEGNYEHFTTHADVIEHTPEISLMLANAYLAIDKVEFAISSLEEISDDSTFRDQKYWFLGLANLKNKKHAAAKKHFIHLQSISNYKKQEIDEILFKINK